METAEPAAKTRVRCQPHQDSHHKVSSRLRGTRAARSPLWGSVTTHVVRADSPLACLLTKRRLLFVSAERVLPLLLPLPSCGSMAISRPDVSARSSSSRVAVFIWARQDGTQRRLAVHGSFYDSKCTLVEMRNVIEASLPLQSDKSTSARFKFDIYHDAFNPRGSTGSAKCPRLSV